MQNRPVSRRSSGSKAVALDPRVILASYRLYLLLSLILSAGLALGLHLFFGR